MPDKIPPEDRERIEAFRQENPGFQKKKKLERIEAPKVGKSSVVESIALNLGYEVESGGRHLRIIDPDTKNLITAFYRHGGSGEITRGTYEEILKNLGFRKRHRRWVIDVHR